MTASRKIQKKETIPSTDFEQSMTQLNKLIETMEAGHLTLESSLQHFEEGIALIRNCQQTLTVAEQKIQLLTKKADKTTLTNFQSNDE